MIKRERIGYFGGMWRIVFLVWILGKVFFRRGYLSWDWEGEWKLFKWREGIFGRGILGRGVSRGCEVRKFKVFELL